MGRLGEDWEARVSLNSIFLSLKTRQTLLQNRFCHRSHEFSRAQGQLGAELLRLKVCVDEELDDARGVLLDHDLTPEAAFLVVRVQDAADFLEGVGNLEKGRNPIIGYY